jgi:hypothetical protein
MANKECAACAKVVYPLEMLKCLDQIWHKTCFKCTVCGSILNMKNYKGLDRKPYCPSHYPQPSKFTVVSDTPEMQRVTQMTKTISNVKYHEEFEKAKSGKSFLANSAVENSSSQTGSSVIYTTTRDHDNNFNRSSTYADQRLSGVEVVQLARTERQQSQNSRNSDTNGHAVAYESPPAAANNDGGDNVAAAHSQAGEEAEDVRTHRAVYDYAAKADDEVSFNEGDYILNGQPIDDGWMYGTVEKTGEYGMLPSNYVEPL